MTVSLTWVDAFSAQPFGGNPAGICLPDSPLSDEHMQSLAFELGIAETAFVSPTAVDDTFELRWFTPAVEVDLCGHATLAAAHALRERGVSDGTHPVTFLTRSGPLIASYEGERIDLDFPTDPISTMPLPDALKNEWDEGDVVEAGSTAFFAMVVLTSEAAVRAYRPNLAAIAATGHKAVLVTAAAEAGSGADYVLRVFGPNVGIDEDPATGSAQCSAGPYWAAALGRPNLVAHQASPRGAILYVRPDGDRVHIGGNATTVFTGYLC